MWGVKYITMLLYISSMMYRKKVLRGLSLSTSDPFTLLTSSGLIGHRRAYYELTTPTAILNSKKKKTRQSSNYLMPTAHHSNQSEIDVDIIIIIIILSYHQHEYPWPSLATLPLVHRFPYPHRAAVCRFELAALLLHGHVKGSIGVHHL